MGPTGRNRMDVSLAVTVTLWQVFSVSATLIYHVETKMPPPGLRAAALLDSGLPIVGRLPGYFFSLQQSSQALSASAQQVTQSLPLSAQHFLQASPSAKE